MSDTTTIPLRVLHWRSMGALSVADTAKVLGVSEPTVRRLIKDRALVGVQGLGEGSRITVPVWSIRSYLGEHHGQTLEG